MCHARGVKPATVAASATLKQWWRQSPDWSCLPWTPDIGSFFSLFFRGGGGGGVTNSGSARLTEEVRHADLKLQQLWQCVDNLASHNMAPSAVSRKRDDLLFPAYVTNSSMDGNTGLSNFLPTLFVHIWTPILCKPQSSSNASSKQTVYSLCTGWDAPDRCWLDRWSGA